MEKTISAPALDITTLNRYTRLFGLLATLNALAELNTWPSTKYQIIREFADKYRAELAEAHFFAEGLTPEPTNPWDDLDYDYLLRELQRNVRSAQKSTTIDLANSYPAPKLYGA